MKLIIIVCISLFLSTNAIANICTKGQQCGNSCISWNKTCHIGQPTIPKSQGTKINNTELNIHNYDNEAKDKVTIEAEFGCMVTWAAMVDLHLFNKSESVIVNDVLYKIKTKAEFNKHFIDQDKEDELRVIYRGFLRKDTIKKEELNQLQTDIESFRREFMRNCTIQTKHNLAIREARG
ncbi:hypothetical protein [Shewanella sp.]|uniref:hypothetical protein n=1 Tax=Shewanella sp. TaxID=50422 RepID=UPI004053F0A1